MDRPLNFVVLGASGGIGSELCRLLRAQGANVTGAARNREKLDALASGCGIRPCVVDATDIAAVVACVAHAEDTFGQVDGIANCVGSLLLKPAHLTSDAEWHATLSTNLTTAFAAVQAGVKAMMGYGGSIVLVSSAAARVGLPNHEAIAAAKSGVIGLVLGAAATYANRRIRVNCVAPGLVQTPLTERLTGSEINRKASIAMHPLGRLGAPADVAGAIRWLLDPLQSWITGQVIGVDGGLSAMRGRA